MIEIWLDTPNGSRLKHLDKVISLEAVHVLNDYGAIAVELPGGVYDQYIQLDGLIEVWYNGQLETVGFTRKIKYYDTGGGTENTLIIGYTGNYLLTSRIIAYAAASAQASMTDYADDMLKEIVQDNLGSDAAGVRNLTSLNITVQAQASDAPSITKGFSWAPLLSVCQDIAAVSKENGTNLYFELVPMWSSDSEIGFEFQTFVGQRGINHGGTSGQPVYFGKRWGNLVTPSLEEDYTNEINYMYTGGQGEESSREIVQVSDAARYGASIWNRREGFADARNESATAGVTSAGYRKLSEGRPVRSFSGVIIEASSTRYGTHWRIGDKVVAEYRGIEYDVIINGVSLSLGSGGDVSVTGRFEVDA